MGEKRDTPDQEVYDMLTHYFALSRQRSALYDGVAAVRRAPPEAAVTAAFFVKGRQRETRTVTREWLHDAWENRETIVLHDGTRHEIMDVRYDDASPLSARVDLTGVGSMHAE